MIQHFRFGSPIRTDSVVQDIPVSSDAVPFLTADADGWVYTMAPDAIVYGLGEMPRGINKRGWHYVTNNTDEARHSEDKLSYYGAHNFLLIDGGAGCECFGVFIDFPGKVRYDIGYTEYDTLRFSTKEPDYELYIITGDDLNAISRQFRQLIGRSYIPPKWAFGLAQSRFGYKTEADIREVAQPAANTAQLNDTALTFWRFAPDGQPAPYRMYTDDGVTTDHNKPEHWRIVGQ